MNAPLYTIEILRLAASLPDAETLDGCHGSADLRSPTCGSAISTQVALDDDERISAFSQKVMACAFGQASAALVARHARGRTRGDVEAALSDLSAWLTGSEILPGWPEIGVLAPVRVRSGRHGAVLLPFRALLAAIEDAST